MRQTTFVFILITIAFCLGWHFAPEKKVVSNDCGDSELSVRPRAPKDAGIKYH